MTFTALDHVTQREPGPWRDCTFASMLETMRLGFPDGELIPPTEAEKEAYRATAGLPDDHTGANLPTAIAAAEKRYGLVGGYFLTSDWLDVKAALEGGFLAVVTGLMSAVPSSLRRWDPSFTGAHAVAARGLTWCDPLAPKGTYTGEKVGIATWQAFFTAMPGAQAFITEPGRLTKGGPMAFLFAFSRWKAVAGKPFYDQPEGQVIGKLSANTTLTILGIPLDRSTDASPGRDYGWRAVLATTAAMDKVSGRKAVYMKRSDLSIEVPTVAAWDDFVLAAMSDPESYKWDDPKPVPPDSTPFSQADLDAAVAQETAEWEAWVTTRPK